MDKMPSFILMFPIRTMEIGFLLFVLLPVTLGASTPNDEFFDVLGTGLKEWRLVFRGTSYINKNMYVAYKDGTDIPLIVRDACKQLNFSQPCDTHYRNSDALNSWNNVLEVLFGIVDGGKIVKTATFSGANTDYLNWFSETHYINSSWPDLATNHPHIPGYFFGIKGHDEVARHFFISHHYRGCPDDAGWAVVVDQVGNTPCDWEKDEAFPVIKYAAGNKFENWNTGNFRNADALVIFVKYSSAANIIG